MWTGEPTCGHSCHHRYLILGTYPATDGTTKTARVPGGGGGGGLGSNYAQMCVSKTEGHVSFSRLQGSEMSENISRKMGLRFAASLNMGENLC